MAQKPQDIVAEILKSMRTCLEDGAFEGRLLAVNNPSGATERAWREILTHFRSEICGKVGISASGFGGGDPRIRGKAVILSDENHALRSVNEALVALGNIGELIDKDKLSEGEKDRIVTFIISLDSAQGSFFGYLKSKK